MVDGARPRASSADRKLGRFRKTAGATDHCRKLSLILQAKISRRNAKKYFCFIIFSDFEKPSAVVFVEPIGIGTTRFR
jgi:hypothetical protein